MKVFICLISLSSILFSQSLRSLEINGNTYFDIKILQTNFTSSNQGFELSTPFYFSISDDGYDFSDCDRFLFRSNLLSDAIQILTSGKSDEDIALTGWFWWNSGIGEISSDRSYQLGWGYNISDYIIENKNQYIALGPMLFFDMALVDDLSIHYLINYGFTVYSHNAHNNGDDNKVHYPDANFMFQNITLNYDDDFFLFLDYTVSISGNGNNRLDFGLGYHLF